MSGYTFSLLISVFHLGYYLPKSTQCKQELGTLWRLCHIQLTLRTEVNSVRLLLCTRQERFNPKFLISLANCHCKMYCWFCKHLSTAFNWAVYINKNMYLLKCWPDQILCHSRNFHMKSCFKEVRHPLLKVMVWVRATHPGVLNLYFHTVPFCFLVVSFVVKDNGTRSAGLSGFSGLRISTMIYMLHRQLSVTEQAAVNSSHSSAGTEKNHQPSQKESSEVSHTWLASVTVYWQKRNILVLRQQENDKSLEGRNQDRQRPTERKDREKKTFFCT